MAQRQSFTRVPHPFVASSVSIIIVASIFAGPRLVLAQNDVMSSPFQLVDGVVVDADLDLLFLMSPTDEVFAVRIGDGELVWSSKEAIKPLMCVGNRLVAIRKPTQPGELLLAILHSETGVVQATMTANVPNDVETKVDRTLKGQFHTTGYAHDGNVIVKWLHEFAPIKAINRGSEENSLKGGAIRINLDEETVSDIDLDDNLRKTLRNSLLKCSHRFVSGEVSVESVSADGRHLAIGRQPKTPNRPYIWEIQEKQSKRDVAEFPFEQGVFSPWFVSDNMVVVRTSAYWKRSGPNDRQISEPRALRALSLRKGQEVWSWPIRDTSFKGPIPE